MATDTSGKQHSEASAESTIEEDENYYGMPDHPAQTYNYSQPFANNITRAELVAGAIILLLWLVIFGAGLLIPTSAMRNTLWQGGTGSLLKNTSFVIGVVSGYTLTNALFLCCFASVLGSMAQRWQVGDGLEKIPANAQFVAATRIYVAALLRGFFLYLMFLSGFLVVSTEDTVIDTEFSQYIRIAGMISIVGFIVGYDPNLLLRFMQRILSIANLPISNQESEGGLKPGIRKPVPK